MSTFCINLYIITDKIDKNILTFVGGWFIMLLLFVIIKVMSINEESMKKLEESMKKMQEKINAHTYKGEAGGGLVVASVNGKGDIIKMEINVLPADLQTPDDIKALQDLIVAAVKKAQDSASGSIIENMGSMFGGDGGKMPDIDELMKMAKELSEEIKDKE